jgi:two-component system response regulator AtoC
MIERAIVTGNGKEIKLKDLPIGREAVGGSVESLEELEKRHIEQILKKYGGNISRSARALNIDRATLYNKIRKYGLKT